MTVRRFFAALIAGVVIVSATTSAVYAAERGGRGAYSPSAPVRLYYELPEPLPASGNVSVPLQLSTPLQSGRLHLEVVSSAGLIVRSDASVEFDLPANQPFTYMLDVDLSADAARYVVILLSVDGALGSQSRSYRIDFGVSAPAPVPSADGLKLLPSSAPP